MADVRTSQDATAIYKRLPSEFPEVQNFWCQVAKACEFWASISSVCKRLTNVSALSGILGALIICLNCSFSPCTHVFIEINWSYILENFALADAVLCAQMLEILRKMKKSDPSNYEVCPDFCNLVQQVLRTTI